MKLAIAMSPRALGRAMAQARRECGLSVFDVARIVGVFSHTINHWERGARWPSMLAVDAYARACGVSLREVLP